MAASKKQQQNPININPDNAGKLRKSAGTKEGDKIPVAKLEELKNSPNAKTRQRATFALNARSWNKGGSPKGGK